MFPDLSFAQYIPVSSPPHMNWQLCPLGHLSSSGSHARWAVRAVLSLHPTAPTTLTSARSRGKTKNFVIGGLPSADFSKTPPQFDTQARSPLVALPTVGHAPGARYVGEQNTSGPKWKKATKRGGRVAFRKQGGVMIVPACGEDSRQFDACT